MLINTLIQIGIVVIAILLIACVTLSVKIIIKKHKLKSKIKQEKKDKIAW